MRGFAPSPASDSKLPSIRRFFGSQAFLADFLWLEGRAFSDLGALTRARRDFNSCVSEQYSEYLSSPRGRRQSPDYVVGRPSMRLARFVSFGAFLPHES